MEIIKQQTLNTIVCPKCGKTRKTVIDSTEMCRSCKKKKVDENQLDLFGGKDAK